MSMLKIIVAPLLALFAVASCGTNATPSADPAFLERMDAIQERVTEWIDASSLTEAAAAAEAAANLVVGPDGPGYGDRDGNGTVAGESTTGLLPGLNGTLVGIAKPLAGITCVVRDVLGSTAEDPATGWSEMAAAISAWRPDNNTMPTLASHPMRVVGWATFTLQSDSLDEAHEYAGHAQLHVDVTVRALGNLIPDPRPSDHTCERTGGELNIDTNVTGHTN